MYNGLLTSLSSWIKQQLELRLVVNRVVVNQYNFKRIFSNELDSSKEYFIDGVIDVTGLSTSIEVPSSGITIEGYSFDKSSITCTDNSYTLLTSPAGGSGNVFIRNISIEISGTSSKVYDITGDTGNEAYEIVGVNFDNCTSLGSIDGYRQGLELETGRFGGTPELELKGTWNGFRVSTSIVRSIDNAMTGSLFKAGTGLTFDSRFITDINCDLGTNAKFSDFSTSNFNSSSLFRLINAQITRNGVFDPTDTTILPNISHTDTESYFKNCQGVQNTYVGGKLTVSTASTTTISAISTFYDIAGSWDTSDMQHFDEPSNGQLRHLGATPREFKVAGYLSIDGTANDVVKINVRKYDSSATSFSDEYQIEGKIQNLAGSRDIAQIYFRTNITLDENDYIVLQVSNESGTNNVEAEVDSYFIVEER